MPRGSDFQARWTEGYWAEEQLRSALNAEPTLFAVQFGITEGTAFWSNAVMAARGLPDHGSYGKRPDILVFRKGDFSPPQLEALPELLARSDGEAEPVAKRAILAIECEFSPYAYKHRLTEYKTELSFTIKDEDLAPLVQWCEHFHVPLGIAQCYLDSAYYLPLATLLSGIGDGSIRKQMERNYNKAVYYPRMSRGFSFGFFEQLPSIGAEVILDRYGKYTAIRKVTGGTLRLSSEMKALLGL